MVKNLKFVSCLILVLFLSASVFAITAKISGSRIVVNLETGDVLDRYFKVINNNDFPLNITMEVVGDLAEDVKIFEKEFILEKNQERDVEFELFARRPGDYTTRINVNFAKLESNESVGLSVIVITQIAGEEIKEESNGEEESDEKTNGFFNGYFSDDGKLIVFLLSIIILLLLILFTLLLFASKKTKKKNGNR